jgi:hypothetical protein
MTKFLTCTYPPLHQAQCACTLKRDALLKRNIAPYVPTSNATVRCDTLRLDVLSVPQAGPGNLVFILQFGPDFPTSLAQCYVLSLTGNPRVGNAQWPVLNAEIPPYTIMSLDNTPTSETGRVAVGHEMHDRVVPEAAQLQGC